MIDTNVLASEVGSITVKKSTEKGAGSPNISSADPKNAIPLTTVPRKLEKHTNIIFFEAEFIKDPNNVIKKYINKADTNLSIIEGSWPPGKPVVNAAIIPDTTPVTIVFFKFEFIIIAMNIQANIKSGLTPKNRGGVTAWSTNPIPKSTADITRSLVVKFEFFIIITFLRFCAIYKIFNSRVRNK